MFTTPFADRLAQAVIAKRSPVLVGLDPRWEQLPPAFQRAGGGADLVGCARAYREFCCGVIDAVAPWVPAVKPQVAFFEQLGPVGMDALYQVIQHARRSDLLVLIDGKRNDIGTTASAYAAGWLGPNSPWAGDALTVSPYLGHDSLEPFVDLARERAAGVFILVKTSNPGGGMLQDLVANDRPLYRRVAEYVEELAAASQGEFGYGITGAVVGATYPQQLAELRAVMPHAWILVPGYGAQGGTAQDVAAGFDARGLGAIVNNSRGILFAHQSKRYGGRFSADQWQAAVEAATRDMIDELRSVARI